MFLSFLGGAFGRLLQALGFVVLLAGLCTQNIGPGLAGAAVCFVFGSYLRYLRSNTVRVR